MAVLGGVALAVLFCRPAPAPVVSPVPQPWPTAELPKHVFRTRFAGRVRVTFQFPLQPTADPLVWHYHPGHPPKIAPPTYRVHFLTIEQALTVSGDTVAVVVEGTVEGIAPDLVRRVSGVPGVLVLRGAVRVAP